MNGFGALGQFALGEVPEGAASVTIYGIAYSFSEPVRFAPRLRAGLNPAFFYQPSPIISIPWFAALSEPVRVGARLGAGLNLSFAFQPTPIISIPWFQALSEPKRFSKALLAGDQPFYSAEPEPEEQDMMTWFRPLSDPKRFPARLDAGQNPAFVRSFAPFRIPESRGYVIT